MSETVLPQKNLQGVWEFTTGYEPAFFDVQIGDRWHFEYESINPLDPIEGKLEMFRDGTLHKSGRFIQREFENPGPYDYDLVINMEGLGASYKIQSISETSLFLQSPSPYRYPGNFNKIE